MIHRIHILGASGSGTTTLGRAMEQRISLITLGVRDLTTVRHFYEHGLGWHTSPASNAHVMFFQTGSMVFALYGKTALA